MLFCDCLKWKEFITLNWFKAWIKNKYANWDELFDKYITLFILFFIRLIESNLISEIIWGFMELFVPRIFLKMIGEDYAHDTTHGVGHFLNVHEGPYFMTLKEGNMMKKI